jgi:hypothetical protein
LDNNYPTAEIGSGEDGLFVDAPGTAATDAVAISDTDSFRNVVMFQPLYADSIPVPIREINWNWSGTVTTNGGVTASNCFTNISKNNHETQIFPYWTNVYKNVTSRF